MRADGEPLGIEGGGQGAVDHGAQAAITLGHDQAAAYARILADRARMTHADDRRLVGVVTVAAYYPGTQADAALWGGRFGEVGRHPKAAALAIGFDDGDFKV
ncbi:hypothetical protein D3C77_355980 [compost metagenome]